MNDSAHSANNPNPHARVASTGRVRARGFTLLEVIIAIALTTMIIGVISSAIRMYFINLRQAQENMELTELARNTLNLMTGDIRAAIQYKPVDVSGLQELLDSQTAAITGPTSSAGEGESGEGDEGTGEKGQPGGNGGLSEGNQQNESSSGESSASNSSSSFSAGTTLPENRPMFVGTNKELAVDVSRLPRLDQYHPILHFNDRGSYMSLPTDVKRVSYFVSMAQDDSVAVSGGLYRRQVDRATAERAGGDVFMLDSAAEQVAAEVVDISFRYFDGEQWQEQWDSNEQAGFPMGVEITIVIDPRRAGPTQAGRYDPAAVDPNTLRTYRTVTRLPLAELLSAVEQELIANPTEFSSPGGAGSSQAPEEGGR